MSELNGKIDSLELLNIYCQAAKKVLPSQRKVFTDCLVIYLMVIQFVRNCSMERVLQEIKLPALDKLSGNCKRIREDRKLSTDPSAYWQAWKRVSEEKILAVLGQTHKVIRGQNTDRERPVVVIDGTTFDIPPTEALRDKYPPSNPKKSGQQGGSVFPQILVLNAHDINTGCAITSEFGARYGEDAENEVNLMHKILPRLEPETIIIADRFHGIHSVVYQAKSSTKDVILRVTDQRIKSLLKRASVPNQGFIDQRFTWTASTFEKKKHRNKADKPVEVRLIAVDLQKEDAMIRLYLVTTLLDMPAQEIIQLYARRWEIEVDIRNLKHSTNMRELSSKSPALVRKEILSGLIAYNLVRAIILLAANKHQKDPKRIKFLYALDAFNRYSLYIARSKSNAERKRLFDELLEMIADKENKIRKRKNYKRQTYRRPNKFPIHESQKTS